MYICVFNLITLKIISSNANCIISVQHGTNFNYDDGREVTSFDKRVRNTSKRLQKNPTSIPLCIIYYNGLYNIIHFCGVFEILFYRLQQNNVITLVLFIFYTHDKIVLLLFIS